MAVIREIETKRRGRPIKNLADLNLYPTGSFGRLQPFNYTTEADEHGSRIYWRCRCSCGNKADIWVRASHLTSKNRPIRSCGCLRSDWGKVLMYNLHQQRAANQ